MKDEKLFIFQIFILIELLNELKEVYALFDRKTFQLISSISEMSMAVENLPSRDGKIKETNASLSQ
jgi:hypothetical protein